MADPTRWTDAKWLQQALVGDGWLSPDSYANHFAPVTKRSAVYLFSVFNRSDFSRCLIAYVGMSTNLKTRLSHHDVLPQLSGPDAWVKRWFKPVPQQQLRDVEWSLIRAFDPPWNIIGRRRGVSLS